MTRLRDELEDAEEIAEIARTRGKILALQEYRKRTQKSLSQCRKDVEMILWRRGIHSETPPTFHFPSYINWSYWALIFVPALIGLALAALVIYLSENYL